MLWISILAKKTKTTWKTKKNNNLLKTKIILNIKMWDKGGLVLHLACHVGNSPLFPSVSYATGCGPGLTDMSSLIKKKYFCLTDSDRGPKTRCDFSVLANWRQQQRLESMAQCTQTQTQLIDFTLCVAFSRISATPKKIWCSNTRPRRGYLLETKLL